MRIVDFNLPLRICFADVTPVLMVTLSSLCPFLLSAFWLFSPAPLAPCQKSLLRSACWARSPHFLLGVLWFQVLGYGTHFEQLLLAMFWVQFPNSIGGAYAFPLAWF